MPFNVHNVRILSKGHVVLSGKLSRGMIVIGHPMTGICLDRKYVWDVKGTVIFRGNCKLGCGGYMSVGEYGTLDIGDGVLINDCSKIICYNSIRMGRYMAAGWECTFLDTDFHSLKNTFTDSKVPAFSPIEIGEYCWLTANCMALKGTSLPAYTTVSAGSVLSGRYNCCEKSILRGNPAQVVLPGFFFRDRDDDSVEYEIKTN